MRVAAGERTGQADHLQQLLNSLPALVLGAKAGMDFEGLVQRLADSHARVEGRVRILEHYLETTTGGAQLLGVELEQVAPTKITCPVVGFSKPRVVGPG